MKLLLLDNYDSFTYNLQHLIQKVSDCEIVVVRNDEVDLASLNQYDKIVLSPGPGLPESSGKLMEVIRLTHSTKSILGVCLGHQALAQFFGARLINLDTVYHGVAMPTIQLMNDIIFEGIPKTFLTGRYHSWLVDKNSLPESLELLAIDNHQNCMAFRHRNLKLVGVQFHPESILTEYGEQFLKNWILN